MIPNLPSHSGDGASLPTLAEIQDAARIVARTFPGTPQYRWPLLGDRLGATVWVKHENNTPIGAFKLRGGLVYFDRLALREPRVHGVVSATRGNHGQSIGFAAALHRIPTTIVVPFGNSREKNAAMRALGVTLVEAGGDFQEAREHAERIAAEQRLHVVPAFHRDLVCGVATYALEFLRAAPDLRTVYVPIGLGSGICGMVAAARALGRKLSIVGVVSAHAPAYALSFEQGRSVSHAVETRLADGLACRVPDPQALMHIRTGVERIVRVTDDQVAEAMRALFTDTHQAAEGAGAAALAAALAEREHIAGTEIGIILSGGNVDREVYARVLAG